MPHMHAVPRLQTPLKKSLQAPCNELISMSVAAKGIHVCVRARACLCVSEFVQVLV